MTAPTQSDDPATRRRALELLDVALDVADEEREPWLAHLRTTEPAVAVELVLLLAAGVRADAVRFLEAPRAVAVQSRAGQRFGAYSLVRLLGEGGMGSVWLAERTDGRFEASVAIKLLHAGLLRAADLERFRREGQLLARLSHPHIARLLDAGVSSEGQPYIVLEYVDGQPIDAACDAAGRGIAARIGLFLQVLDAVAHAHARLVVHRDLKPGNVLVDADGRVKLLDFGIAKLVDGGTTAASELTRESGRAFTPQYAAPEQIAGEAITTATDVYALGALLYVLLAGAMPTRRGGPPGAPPLASATARSRGDDARARALVGDLDNIVAKALQADPAARYATVDAFAEDLRRHLRGEVVSARRPSLGYRVSRFVRRHRGSVAASVLTLVAIGTGAGVAVWQAREARLQRAVAERHATVAVARGAAAYAVTQTAIRIDRALLLGVEAVRRHAAPETSAGLLAALDASRHLVRFRNDLGVGLRSFEVNAARTEAVSLDDRGVVRRVSLADGRLLARRDTGAPSAFSIFYLADERLLVVGSDRGAEMLDAGTLLPSAALASVPSPDPTRSPVISVSDDGALAAAAVYTGTDVVVTDARTGAAHRRIAPRDCGRINGIAFLPAATELAVACELGMVFYDARSGRHLRGVRGAPYVGLEVAGGSNVAALIGFDPEPRLVDLRTLEPLAAAIVLPGGRAYSTRFDRSGRYLAIGMDTGGVTVWDIVNRREIARIGGLEDGVLAIAWLADDFEWNAERGITGDARLLVATATTTTEWDLGQASAVGRVVPGPELPRAHYQEDAIDAVRGVAYRRRATNGSGAPQAVIEKVALADARVLATFVLAAADVSALTVSADGLQLFATAAYRPAAGAAPPPRLLVLSTADGSLVSELRPPPDFAPDGAGAAPSLAARFSSNADRIAAVSRGKLAVWTVATGAILGTATVHPQTRLLSWSPDDRTLASTRERAIVALHDSATLRTVGQFVRTDDFTIKHMFPSTPLGGIVVTCESGEVYVLDAAKAVLVGEPFQSGGSQLQRSAVSADGRMLAAWGADGAVRVWDVATRSAIGPPLRGHPAGRLFNRIWFASDGTLSTYTPGLRIDWDLDVRRAATRACRRAARALTPAEWRQFVGDVPYEPSCAGA